jgi:hypothetical protein
MNSFTPSKREIKLHNAFHDLYSLPSIIRAIKWKWMRWTWHVACTKQKRNIHKVLWVNPTEREHDDRWCANVRTDPQQTPGQGVDWIDLSWTRNQWKHLVDIFAFHSLNHPLHMWPQTNCAVIKFAQWQFNTGRISPLSCFNLLKPSGNFTYDQVQY